MKKILITLILLLVIGLAVLTRFYKLGEAPAGLYVDEAGQGYSAYSILKTGKDEFGKNYPIVFRSFTDFKTPVYIYSIVPLIPQFGLTPFTIRFPSFLFSILTIPILFLLVRKLTPKNMSLPLAFLATFLFAISPWHIVFSRTYVECNLALFFLLSGVYVFYLSLQRPFLLLVAAVLFAVAVPAYHSQRLVTPLVVIFLALRHKKIIFSKTHKKWLILACVVGFVLTIPMLSIITTPGFLARAAGLNIFSEARVPAGFVADYQGIFSWLVNSRWFLSVQEFIALYLSYFSPRLMFNVGDYEPRSSFPELATFFIWQLPFYLVGLYIFTKSRLGELKFFVLILLLLAPIPAAITRDPYNTYRSLPLVIPQTIIISLGIISVFVWAKGLLGKLGLKKVFLPGVAIFSVLLLVYSLGKLYSSAILLNEYFRARDWDWGWDRMVAVTKTFDSSLPIIIDNSRKEPYIELAFFLQYDPAKYQKENKEIDLENYYTDMNRKTTIKFDNITTRPINWGKDLRIMQYLIGDELAISPEQITRHGLTLIKEIKYPDKTVAFRIVKTNLK